MGRKGYKKYPGGEKEGKGRGKGGNPSDEGTGLELLGLKCGGIGRKGL